MKVVLTEKPSVARELARYLGASSRQDGYYTGNGYHVVWALGHLVGLKEPHEYDAALRRWSMESLPFIPEKFELKVLPEGGSRKQFAVVRRLFKEAEQIICATDAGREGELIFRYIKRLAGCWRKHHRRLWLSSLTQSAIRQAFENLHPGERYDRLYEAARCRSEADWIVGMNATRNYTVRYGGKTRGKGILWSVGRVQTPVLAMVVRRDDEIRTFRSEPFWELLTQYRQTEFKHAGDRFTQKDEAEKTLAQVRGRPFEIRKVIQKTEISPPPLLFDLTELQREMNRRHSFSAALTLQSAQRLYEQKLITYPRTDSRYLSQDMKSETPRILEQLAKFMPQPIAKLDLKSLPASSRVYNDAKVTDHHAIIPTGSAPGQLSDHDRQVYDALAIRFVAVFYPPCVKDVTTVDGRSQKIPFRAKGVRVTQAGWTELYPSSNTDDPPSLPSFQVGESGPHQPSIREGKTTPPPSYTENTLLGAMAAAGKLVDEEELKEALKERGLGTPATRASIMETLLQRRYIQRRGKSLSATDLGRYLIALLRSGALKSAELTGQWEAKLKAIEQGKLSAKEFMEQIAEFTREIIAGGDASLCEVQLGPCPHCGRPVIKGRRDYGCSGWKEGCSFVLARVFEETELSVNQVRELLQWGMISAAIQLGGREAVLAMSEGGHVVWIPVPSPQDQKRTIGRAKRRRRSTRSQAPPGNELS